MSLTRRTLLASSLAFAGLTATGAWASPNTDRRLLLVLLRGGMDGLAAVPPIGDPAYASARGSVALDPGDVTPLDGVFGLHSALAPLHPLWKDGELAVLHATGLAGGGRSHFDAQDVLDNGTTTAQGARSGWLNRAVGLLDPHWGAPMALGRQVPLVLRGPAKIRAADPVHPPNVDPDFLQSVRKMYAADRDLSPALDAGIDTQALVARHLRKPGRRALSSKTAHAIGTLLAAPDGPRVAALEVGGWDTHARQSGVLKNRLGELAEGLLAIRTGLGSAWSKTTVVAVSEFGRTVKGNGTGGTDHGTAGVALIAGGAVRGKKVYGDWPGLRTPDLFEGRDLKTTTDIRALFKGLLVGHLGLAPSAVDRQVFPNTTEVRPLIAPFG